MKLVFRSLSIFCTDLERTYLFYRDILGAETIRTEIARRWIRIGQIEINLVPNASLPSTTDRFPEFAMTVLWLEVDDFTRFLDLLAAKNIEPIESDEEQFVMIADPDGLIIEIWQKE